jgi:dehydrogenase/reductase SDR family protein 1
LVAMISSFGSLSYTFNVAYGVGKCAVDRMTKDMAAELSMSDQDVCVTSFWPGVVNTERTQISVESGDWDEFVGIPLDNAESPQYTGRAIVAVATDAGNRKKSGTNQVVAELAQEYGFVDVNGKQPPSIRSLRFLLPAYAFDDKMRQSIPTWSIPDWKLPFWLIASGRPPKPDETGVKQR